MFVYSFFLHRPPPPFSLFLLSAVHTSALSSKSLLQPHSLFPCTKTHQPVFSLPSNTRSHQSISVVHAAEPAKTLVITKKTPKSFAPPSTAAPSRKWAVDRWKSEKALQLPEYLDEAELEFVLKTIEAFPPIIFANYARSLEEKLAGAALGNAFLLQGGDCAESFKEFSANNIRDTFRIILQMRVVLMFGGQMPIIKVGRIAGQFVKPRLDPLEEKNGVKLPSYKGDNTDGDAFNEKLRIPDP
ncbi:unnamed protein product [Ilex paraguariensis]|uniref:Phospho-2-dehydro-3-deoxyheptonate aldolase n=1 Tax=Ilex paraguariensis TaxID=185542 RepID=A0ABC8UNV2_9AQUA